MMKMKKIVTKLGGSAALAQDLGVTPGAVRSGIREGAFPASWYFVMCEKLGEELPRELFSFRRLDGKGKAIVRSRAARGGASKPSGSRAAAGSVKGGKSAAGATAGGKAGDIEGEA